MAMAGGSGQGSFPVPFRNAHQGKFRAVPARRRRNGAGRNAVAGYKKCGSRSGRFAQMVILPILTDKILTPTWGPWNFEAPGGATLIRPIWWGDMPAT